MNVRIPHIGHAEEHSAQSPERRTLTGFVRTEYDVEPWLSVCNIAELDYFVRERAVSPQVHLNEFHYNCPPTFASSLRNDCFSLNASAASVPLSSPPKRPRNSAKPAIH